MHSTGIADLPLHWGNAPKWLFERMVSLASNITEIIVSEWNEKKFLERLADPYWFQAFSCVLGFDWHSSGTTTVSCAALKEALNKCDIGLRVAGGKGKASKNTPNEILKIAREFSFTESKTKNLINASKLSAKVDNNALQDGFQLYHHVMVLSEKGDWVIIQQGLNESNNFARRYHWLSEKIESFIEEPHSAICSDIRMQEVLNLTSKQSKENRKTSLDLVKEQPEKLLTYFNKLNLQKQRNLFNWENDLSERVLFLPQWVNWEALKKAFEFQPSNFEEFLMIKGIGQNTVRALALISELIFGSKTDWSDPVKFSFALGGKDGVPFPVNKKAYDESIQILEDALKQTNLKQFEKLSAIKRLRELVPKN